MHIVIAEIPDKDSAHFPQANDDDRIFICAAPETDWRRVIPGFGRLA